MGLSQKNIAESFRPYFDIQNAEKSAFCYSVIGRECIEAALGTAPFLYTPPDHHVLRLLILHK